MDQKRYTVLIYTQYYGTDQLPPKDLAKIRGLNRDNVLRFLIAVKIAVTKTSGGNIEHAYVRLLLRDLPKEHGNRLATMLSTDSQAYFLSHPVVIDQILADILNEAQETEVPRLNQVWYFALALLELLMIYNDHHYRQVLVADRPDSHELVWEIMQLQNINGNNQASFVRSGIIKQAIFLEFLKFYLGDRYKEFDQQMAAMIGIKALSNSALLYIQLQVAQDSIAKTDKPWVIVTPKDEIYPVLHQLRLVIDVQAKEGTFDSGRVIMHPFLKLSDGNLYLTGTHDFSMITDKGWEFFLYSAGQIGRFIPEIRDVNALRSFIGLHYVEKFLMGKIFNKLHRTGCRVILSDDQQTPDLTLIINETDVFIFEVKSASLNYKVWQEQDLTAFKKYLDEQFVKGKKGVVQLHKCLKNLADKPGELFGLRTPLRKLRIYPVIIFTEPHLTITGVNDYVNLYAPPIAEDLSVKFQRIHPVTLIHHDFFLENYSVIRDDKTVLKAAIIKYHQGTKDLKTAYQKFNSTANYMKAMQSFDNYIAGFNGLYEVPQDIISKELAAIFNPVINFR